MVAVSFHVYRAYIYQCESEINALLFLKNKLGDYDIVEGIYACLIRFVALQILSKEFEHSDDRHCPVPR